MAAVMTEKEIQNGWQQAWSFSGDRPLGTHLVEIKETMGRKYYLLTDGCGNWYYTSEGTIRMENELKQIRRYPRQQKSL